MKVGLQTISWGPTPSSLVEFLSCASDLDCAGIELAQAVEVLGSADEIRDQVGKCELKIAGLAGGSLVSRIPYAMVLKPDYLYVDEWDEPAVVNAIRLGLKVAIHPHFCKALNTIQSVRPYLDHFPDVGLILDTAHQYLSDDDVIGAFEKFRERVVSIHLKDWHPKFGKSPQHFARGFTHLGHGILSDVLERLVVAAKLLRYDKWLIIEQDSPPGDPCEYAKKSREWLRTFGV
jgi:sugar phosphate isomerase/epimerase